MENRRRVISRSSLTRRERVFREIFFHRAHDYGERRRLTYRDVHVPHRRVPHRSLRPCTFLDIDACGEQFDAARCSSMLLDAARCCSMLLKSLLERINAATSGYSHSRVRCLNSTREESLVSLRASSRGSRTLNWSFKVGVIETSKTCK